MVGRSRVLSDIAVAFEDAGTIGSDHLQGAQIPGRVEVGMVRMARPCATEPVALSVSPVLLETRMAAWRRLPGILENGPQSRALRNTAGCAAQRPGRASATGPVEWARERPSPSRLDVPQAFQYQHVNPGPVDLAKRLPHQVRNFLEVVLRPSACDCEASLFSEDDSRT